MPEIQLKRRRSRARLPSKRGRGPSTRMSREVLRLRAQLQKVGRKISQAYIPRYQRPGYVFLQYSSAFHLTTTAASQAPETRIVTCRRLLDRAYGGDYIPFRQEYRSSRA